MGGPSAKLAGGSSINGGAATANNKNQASFGGDSGGGNATNTINFGDFNPSSTAGFTDVLKAANPTVVVVGGLIGLVALGVIVTFGRKRK